METIQVARDFSRYPGGRYKGDGAHSGEEFRETLLVPKLRAAASAHEVIVVELDGAMGYPASFLDEAFGGLIRNEGFTYEEVIQHLEISASSPRFKTYRELIFRYLDDARSGNQVRNS